MHKRTSLKIFANAKQLHRNMTPAETILWAKLRAHRFGDVHFRNQHAIENYIVDFCAPRRKLIIELDGGQHIDQAEYDAERTAFLTDLGYRILRFWNNEVITDLDTVLRNIDIALSEERSADPLRPSATSPIFKDRK